MEMNPNQIGVNDGAKFGEISTLLGLGYSLSKWHFASKNDQAILFSRRDLEYLEIPLVESAYSYGLLQTWFMKKAL